LPDQRPPPAAVRLESGVEVEPLVETDRAGMTPVRATMKEMALKSASQILTTAEGLSRCELQRGEAESPDWRERNN
jgi:hypothetical protein